MDAIKKKMQGIKVAKDNAEERAETGEAQLRDAKARFNKVISWLVVVISIYNFNQLLNEHNLRYVSKINLFWLMLIIECQFVKYCSNFYKL